MMHAENGLAIDVVAGQTFAAGDTDPYYHGTSRSPVLEGEATNRVIRLAEVAGAPVYIVHLSAREALNEVRRARDEGLPAFAETCPQYLFLSLEDMGDGFNGAKFVCSPPLRPADHQEDLWLGLLKDDLQVVSTDHCPFDFHGQKEMGMGDFRKVPNGLPGVENRVDLLHDGGVVTGRLTPNRWVEVISAAPARMFGLPQKGAVAVGLDADLVDLRPGAQAHHQRLDPPHERRLLVLRGARGDRGRRRRPLARQDRGGRRRVARRQGRRPIPEAPAQRLSQVGRRRVSSTTY